MDTSLVVEICLGLLALYILFKLALVFEKQRCKIWWEEYFRLKRLNDEWTKE